MAVDLIWDTGGQKKKLWEQAMLLLSPALSFQFWRSSGEKTPLWQIRRIRMPSQTPICTRKGAFCPTQKIKKGRGSPPPTYNYACSLLSSSPKQQSQWMAGSQRACGSVQRMWPACNSMQQSGVCATACSGSKRMGAASSTIAMEDSDGSRQRWQRKEQRLTATSC